MLTFSSSPSPSFSNSSSSIDCIVALDSLGHCSIQLPYSLLHLETEFSHSRVNSISRLMPFKMWLSPKEDEAVFVNWNGGISTITFPASHRSDNKGLPVIEMDASFALELGISHGQKVTIEPISSSELSLPVPTSIIVEPKTENDWEITERYAGFIEEFMLNQVRLVARNQPFVIHVDDSTIVRMTVVEINADMPSSKEVYTLQEATEVYVSPKLRKRQFISDPSATSELDRIENEYRIKVCGKLADHELSSGVLQGGDLVRVEKIGFSTPDGFDTVNSVELIVKHANLEETNVVYVSNSTFLSLGCKLNSIVKVSISLKRSDLDRYKLPKNLAINVIPSTSSIEMSVETITEMLEAHMQDKYPFIINNGSLYRFNDVDCRIRLESQNEESNHVDSAIIRSEKDLKQLENSITVGQFLPSLRTYILSNQNHVSRVSGRQSTIKSIDRHIRACLAFCKERNIDKHTYLNFMVHGQPGSGKSEIARHLSHTWSQNIYVELIDCFNLTQSSNAETISKKLAQIIEDAAYADPSLLIFDDFEILLEYAKQSPQIWKILKSITDNDRCASVVNVFFCQKVDDLYSTFLKNTVFIEQIPIPPLNREDRFAILQKLMKKYPKFNVSTETLKNAAEKTDGFVPLDLKTIVEKTVNIASCKISSFQFDDIIFNYVPVNLSGAKLETPNTKWSDVGGMFTVKKECLKAVQWPLKYAHLYKKANLKIKSGLLLYGPPGCGKTFLVPAIANECRLKYISVRGPELIDKYIGASEQAIRDVFTRARLAAPCLLFFDEFDSIAQKRGQEFSGVTDRMVNQLLTELDGADELEGVVVIAATSSPEVIDPALLRPGRLETRIYCSIPTEKEREDILRIVGKKAGVEGVKWNEIASRCEGWTNADLQALITNARVLAAQSKSTELISSLDNFHAETENTDEYENLEITHSENICLEEQGRIERMIKSFMKPPLEKTDESKDAKNVLQSSKIVITRKDLKSALVNFKPSLSKSQILQFEHKYKLFREGKVDSLGTKSQFM